MRRAWWTFALSLTALSATGSDIAAIALGVLLFVSACVAIVGMLMA